MFLPIHKKPSLAILKTSYYTKIYKNKNGKGEKTS